MSDQLPLAELDIPQLCDYADEDLIKVPINMTLDEDMPGEAIGLWVVMKSFGKRASASIRAYAERTGWHPETLKKWQTVIEAAGWMTLLREGKGGTTENSVPRLWWMSKYKGEKPPLGAFLTPPPVKVLPSKNTPPKQRGLKVHKGPSINTPTASPWMSTDGKRWGDFVEAYWLEYQKVRFENKLPVPEVMPQDARGMGALKKLLNDPQITFDRFVSRLKNLGRHDFAAKQDWSLFHFCTHFREFEDGSKSFAQGRGREAARYLPAKADGFKRSGL